MKGTSKRFIPPIAIFLTSTKSSASQSFSWKVSVIMQCSQVCILPAPDEIASYYHYQCREVSVTAHDLHSLLFSFLDELLYIFNTEFFVMKELTVSTLDRDEWSIKASGYALSLSTIGERSTLSISITTPDRSPWTFILCVK